MPLQPPLGSIQCNNLFTVDNSIGQGLRGVLANKENDLDYNAGRRDIIFNRKRNNEVPPMNAVTAPASKSISIVECEDHASLINGRASTVN